MKNILTILVLFLSYTCLSQDSFNTIDQEIKYDIDLKLDKVSYGGSHYNSGGNIPVGVGMMVGGSSFIVAGLLTPPTYVCWWINNGEKTIFPATKVFTHIDRIIIFYYRYWGINIRKLKQSKL